jgi:hypothetical protein
MNTLMGIYEGEQVHIAEYKYKWYSEGEFFPVLENMYIYLT